MHVALPKPAISLGFLTIVEMADWGYVGGYLLLNGLGRPLEFHCTSPLKPNRAQEILYGPTLRPYVYGELIGKLLVSKSSQEPLLICTDVPEVLETRQHIERPVVLVLAEPPAAAPPREHAGLELFRRVDAAHGPKRPWHPFRHRQHWLAVPASHPQDEPIVTERCAALRGDFDLLEPFTRIREAIAEAQRGAR
jgi:hypothetical protein